MGKLIDRLLLKVLDLDRLNRLRASQNLRDGLQYQFPDENGLRWYTFTDADTFPLSRLAPHQDALKFLQCGLSADEYLGLVQKAYDCFNDGDYAMAGALLTQMKEMPDRVKTLDALINIVAAHYVREDEDPVIHSTTIHQAKCNWIKSQAEGGGFFFRHPSLIASLAALGVSGRTFTDNLTDCIRESARIRKMIHADLSAIRSQT